jgi:predicted SAM-dependent methyltransferase
MKKCKICSSLDGNILLTLEEKMYGTGESFEYIQCASCGCIQLSTVPENMQNYYQGNYSAYNVRQKKKGFIMDLLRKWSASYCTGISRHPGGLLTYRLFGAGFVEKFKNMQIPFSTKILDIGTGAGQNLLSLQRYGFTNVSGTDLFTPDDILNNTGFNIKKISVFDIKEQYDLVMLNHVLEHMDEQHKVVEKLHEICNDDGLVMIRVPVNGGYSYRKYGENWVAFDAPRHFYIHSVNSLTHLFNTNGFELTKLFYDSSEYQFWASEQYQLRISLHDERSYSVNPDKSIFTRKQINAFRKKARELNNINDGNAAVFFFRKR